MSNNKLSLNQERYVLAEKFTDGNYSLPISHIIEGKLDKDKLRISIMAVMERHDAFSFSLSDTSKTSLYDLKINTKIELNIDYQSAENDDSELIKKHINDYFYKEVDFTPRSLFRFQLIQISDNKYVFTFSIHHIFSDGISIALFIKDLSDAWNDLDSYKLNPNSSYLKCINENNLTESENLGDYVLYWNSYLKGANDVRVHPDYMASKDKSYDKKIVSHVLNKELTQKIDKISKNFDVSVFNVFYAAYNILISRYSNESDICTTFQSSGRQLINDSKSIIGLFSCTLILRENIDNNITFCDLSNNIRNNVYNCISNQKLPYHYIIKNTSIHPRFGMNWHPDTPQLEFSGLNSSRHEYVSWQSDFELNLHCAIVGEELYLKLQYDHHLFSESRVLTILEQFENILIQISNEDKTDIKLSDITLTSTLDYKLSAIDECLKEHSNPMIFDEFIEVTKIHPKYNALHYAGKYWTYEDVDLISKKIAILLRNKDENDVSTVAIYAERSPALVMAILGVLRAGGSFVVLDSLYPEHRLEEYWDVLEPNYLIVCTTEGTVPVCLEERMKSSDHEIIIPHDISTESEVISTINDSAINSFSSPEFIAYYLFTSGTTGRPKCVAANHIPLTHFINWQSSTFSMSNDDRFTMLSGLGHDPVLRDIFTPLSIGACLLIPEEKVVFNSTLLYKWFMESKPSVCHLTPQMSKLISTGYRTGQNIDSMRYYFFGGDALRKDHVQNIVEVSPNAKIVNFYGATETPQAMGYHQVVMRTAEAVIPIGSGIADVQLLILTSTGCIAGISEIGQIAIRTRYLSNGYTEYNAQESSLNISSLNERTQNDEIPVYLTGDYGYYQPDGNIVLKGRIDDQVKIRGYRVELNDVNNHLKSIRGVSDALCLAIDSSNDEKRLVAYLVKEQNKSVDTIKINTILSTMVPNYMVPTYYIWLEAIPLLPNGKVDRNSLPNPNKGDIATSERQYVPASNDFEDTIVKEWEKILAVEKISIKDSFASLGGDSLSFVQTSLFLEKILGHVPDNWNSISIEQLAKVKHTKSIFYAVNTSIIIRAISIYLVVIGHFWIKGIHGATDTLLLVAGFSFADFQLKSVAYTNSSRPIFNSTLKIIIPTTLYSLFLALYLHSFTPEILLLYSNFIDPHMGNKMAYWFIQVLVQILIIMGLLFSSKRLRDYAIKKPYMFGIYFVLIAMSMVVLGSRIWDTNYLYDRVPHMKLWAFALGFYFFHSKTLSQKIIAFFLMFPMLYVVYGSGFNALVFTSGLLLLFIPKVKLIAPLHKVVYVLAGASLFIYLTHFQFKALLHTHLHYSDSKQLDVVVGLLGGVLVWYLWNEFPKLVSKRSLYFKKNS